MPRLLSSLLLTATVILLLPSVAAANGRGCRGADVPATASTAPVVRAALVCLHARVRAAHGLRRLRPDADLAQAAKAHSATMVRRRFFSHAGPSGGNAAKRALRAGFRRARRVVIGENIGWGSAGGATARHIMGTWLASPGHRAHVLSRRYRTIGVGIAPGSPRGSVPHSATFTVVFAGR